MTKTNTTATATAATENLTALKHVMTAAVGRKMMRTFLGDGYSPAQAATLAGSVTAIAMQSDPNSLHGSFIRMISRGLCAQATTDLIDVASKVITAGGEIKDADVHKEACCELESVFGSIEQMEENIDRFSTQAERVIEATPEQAKVIDVPSEPAKKHMPAGHKECELCHMPGKKTKGSVLKLKKPELMPDSVRELDGKWLCPKCLNSVNELIRKAIADEEARIKAEREAQAAKDAAEAEAKYAAEQEAKAKAEQDAQMEKLLALRAQEEELAAELGKCETYADCAPASMKEVAKAKVEEIRTSLGNVRENIASIEALMNGGTTIETPTVPAPSIVKKLSKKERKALRKAGK